MFTEERCPKCGGNIYLEIEIVEAGVYNVKKCLQCGKEKDTRQGMGSLQKLVEREVAQFPG